MAHFCKYFMEGVFFLRGMPHAQVDKLFLFFFLLFFEENNLILSQQWDNFFVT